jgi:hypothetical protein
MSGALTQDGLTAWSVPAISDVPILTDTPAGGKLDLYAQACHGQTVPLSFCLRADRPVMVEVEAKPTCPHCAPQLEVKHVNIWWQNRAAAYGERDPGLVPELLVNDPQFAVVSTLPQWNRNLVKADDAETLQPNVQLPGTHQYWVRVSIPEACPSGRYTVPITVKQSGWECMHFSVNVDVLPFELPPPSMIYSMYDTSELETGKNPKTAAQYVAELRSMVRKGIRSPILWQDCIAAFQEPTVPEFITKLDWALALRKEKGISNNPLYIARIGVPWATEAALPTLVERLRKCKEFMAARGITDLYVMGYDEPDEERMRAQKPIFAACKAAGFKTMMACQDDMQLAHDILGDTLDLPLFHEDNPSPWTRAWLYGASTRENPYWHRKRFGLQAMLAGYEGVCPFAFQQTMGPSPNDDLDAGRKDHEYVHTTANGCVETIQLDGLAAAVDDVRFATLLRQLGGDVPTLEGRDLDEVRAEMVANILLLLKG